MSDHPSSQTDVVDSLDFEHAEYAEQPKGAACETCGKDIPDYYYHVGGKTMCKHCQPKVAAELGRSPRFLRAVGFGVLAALAGSLIWYGIIAATGYEFGLIAIVVGLMVGGAVRMGSGATGGLSLQLLAVFLTYTSIVASYAPLLFQEFETMAEEQAPEGIRVGGDSEPEPADVTLAAAAAGAAGTEQAVLFLESFGDALTTWSDLRGTAADRDRTLDATYLSLQQLLEIDAAPRFAFGGTHVQYAGATLLETAEWTWNERLPEIGVPSIEFNNEATRVDLMGFLDEAAVTANADEDLAPMAAGLGIAFIIALIYLSPILAGFENIIGLLIIGFALWEAWKLNRRPDIQIAGPFQVKGQAATV